jgi:hypothetical protein
VSENWDIKVALEDFVTGNGQVLVHSEGGEFPQFGVFRGGDVFNFGKVLWEIVNTVITGKMLQF